MPRDIPGIVSSVVELRRRRTRAEFSWCQLDFSPIGWHHNWWGFRGM